MQSRATAQWQGDLMSGKGRTSAASGTFRDAGLSWRSRTGDSKNGCPISSALKIPLSVKAALQK